MPGASTKAHLFTQHGLSVNGPLFPNPADGPVNLLTACTLEGHPSVIKMLLDRTSAEANAIRALYDGITPTIPLVSCKLIELCLTEDHASIGRAPGTYAGKSCHI
jgi:hypothetical protein